MEKFEELFKQYDELRAELQREEERVRSEYDQTRDEYVEHVMKLDGVSFSAAVDKVEGFCLPYPSRAEVKRLWRESSALRKRITKEMYKDPIARRIHMWEPAIGSDNPFDPNNPFEEEI